MIEFNKEDLSYIGNGCKEQSERISYIGDISDLGNELGIIIGYRYKDINGDDIESLINGIRHGISLTNGTH
jgi:hypothetical protein